MITAPRIVLTPGEPAGIGPELIVKLAQREQAARLIAVADANLLQNTAKRLGVGLHLPAFDAADHGSAHAPGTLAVVDTPLAEPALPGTLNGANAAYVLETLNRACDLCLHRNADALVTGPVHKGVIAEAGFQFTGHTEYLARRCNTAHPVMMLASDELRVVLVTTHLPLSQVSAAVTIERLESVLRTTCRALQVDFEINSPRIAVLGLNPHAGENGHLGREEIDVIAPVLDSLRHDGLDLFGPLAADTAFTPRWLSRVDAFVAMYHDQGLPVLKYAGFGRAVNITLGLPIVRTSVDHGTGLDIAGQGLADLGSLQQALDCAIAIARRRGA